MSRAAFDVSAIGKAMPRRIRDGDRRLLAECISALEDGDQAVRDIVRSTVPQLRSTFVVGLTGAPGVGKSSLIACLVDGYRSRAQRVAVVAVDPSSPVSGGALLGDRIRMTRPVDGGVFYRSIASRGAGGGLSPVIGDVLRLLELAGFDVVLLETVGAGQAELAVVHYAHSILVISQPGAGDDIQLHKSGILEVADVFVLNKADHEGAKRAALALRNMAKLHPSANGWERVVCETVAIRGTGTEELIEAIERHRTWSNAGAGHRSLRREWLEGELAKALLTRLLAEYRRAHPAAWNDAVNALAAGDLDPLAAADQLLAYPIEVSHVRGASE